MRRASVAEGDSVEAVDQVADVADRSEAQVFEGRCRHLSSVRPQGRRPSGDGLPPPRPHEGVHRAAAAMGRDRGSAAQVDADGRYAALTGGDRALSVEGEQPDHVPSPALGIERLLRAPAFVGRIVQAAARRPRAAINWRTSSRPSWTAPSSNRTRATAVDQKWSPGEKVTT